jgi:hypothetical protein
MLAGPSSAACFVRGAIASIGVAAVRSNSRPFDQGGDCDAPMSASVHIAIFGYTARIGRNRGTAGPAGPAVGLTRSQVTHRRTQMLLTIKTK